MGESWRGQTIWHEISESFEGGIISINTGKEATKAYKGEPNTIYNQAHAKASRIFPASPVPKYGTYQIGWDNHNEIIGYEFE